MSLRSSIISTSCLCLPTFCTWSPHLWFSNKKSTRIYECIYIYIELYLPPAPHIYIYGGRGEGTTLLIPKFGAKAEVVSFTLWPHYRQNKALGTHWTGGCKEPRVGQDAVVSKSLPIPDCPVQSHVAISTVIFRFAAGSIQSA